MSEWRWGLARYEDDDVRGGPVSIIGYLPDPNKPGEFLHRSGEFLRREEARGVWAFAAGAMERGEFVAEWYFDRDGIGPHADTRRLRWLIALGPQP